MTEFQAKAPDYKGDISLSAWINTDKNGKQYLTFKVGDLKLGNLFKNEPRDEPYFKRLAEPKLKQTNKL